MSSSAGLVVELRAVGDVERLRDADLHRPDVLAARSNKPLPNRRACRS
ncbi:MAG TPA: hypothetical protein VLR26_11410 [Frankiaceae bacterium]|nr:hypothetical protein [Frankiaceae bacterium]